MVLYTCIEKMVRLNIEMCFIQWLWSVSIFLSDGMYFQMTSGQSMEKKQK